jgi:hypothetical protein
MQETATRSPYWYLHVARASDLTGADARFYRWLEILPGALSLGTLALFVGLSFWRPSIAAFLTIIFSIYWVLKTFYLSIHLRHNFKRMQHNMALDWEARLASIPHDHVLHLAIFPLYKEGYEVIAESVEGLLASAWDPKRIALVIALEERGGGADQETAQRILERYGGRFFAAISTTHPAGLSGELAGKGSNMSWAAEEARTRILDPRHVPYKDVLVSAFDVDTVVYPQYFACLTWHFLTAERPERSSFQPVPLYNNNIWHASLLSRVMAYSSSFWQMIQQERPEKLATFSSHAVPFSTLYEAGYWQRNVVSEDSRIFWNLFVRFDGDYEVVPLAYPVSMDANVAPSLWGTMKQIYLQHRRWTYGAENIAYILFCFSKNPRIPRWKKFRAAAVQLEGFWSLVTHPLVLFFVGWLPLFVGGASFHASVLSYNLPVVARAFLTCAMLGLVVSAIVCSNLIPPRPSDVPSWRRLTMILQWVLVPITMVVFSSVPGLDAQLRLMTGRYLGFWVTPKNRDFRRTAAQPV